MLCIRVTANSDDWLNILLYRDHRILKKRWCGRSMHHIQSIYCNSSGIYIYASWQACYRLKKETLCTTLSDLNLTLQNEKITYDLWYSKKCGIKRTAHYTIIHTSATLKHSNHSCPPTCTARRSDLCGSMLLAKRWFNRRAKDRRRVDTKCLAVRWRSY